MRSILKCGGNAMDPSTCVRDAASPDTREAGWRAKHRSELLQQQRDHLQQLQLLHAQLIKEVASELSASPPAPSVPDSPQQIAQLLQQLSLSVDGTKTAPVSPGPPSVCSPWLQGLSPARGQALVAASPNEFYTVPKQVSVTMATTPLLPGCTPNRKATPPHPPHHSPVTRHTLTPPATPQQHRPDLVAKHARHVEDLRQYYEGELLLLQQQLAVLGPQATSEEPEASMSARCASLEKEMEDLCEEKAALEAKAAQLQDLASEFQKQAASSEVLAEALQERVDSSHRQLLQQEKYTHRLKEMLESAQKELEFCKLQTTNEKETFEQLKRDHEVMNCEIKQFQTVKYCLQEELLHTRQELCAMKASTTQFKSQETQYKSTILRLEEEVRHLQHVNNRLNSLSTHYQFGSQHPISRDKTTPPSPPPITYNTASTPPSPSPITSKIARRKWLEASDPGLICGGAPAPGPNGPHPSPSQQSQEMAESTLRAIRTGNIIPDVKKLQVGGPVGKGRGSDVEGANKAHKLLSLQKEQDQLLTVLQKIPRTSATTHKQRKLLMEGRLEKVVKEIEALNTFLQQGH